MRIESSAIARVGTRKYPCTAIPNADFFKYVIVYTVRSSRCAFRFAHRSLDVGDSIPLWSVTSHVLQYLQYW
jgi:hypothetical protein